jgi:hypothetical protein
MSNATASEPVTLNRPGGGTLTFPRCSPSDWYRLRYIFRAYRKAGRLQTLGLVGITGKDAVPHLDEIDAKRLPDDDVAEFINHPEGQREAILLSLRVADPNAAMSAVDAMGLDEGEMFKVAVGVFPNLRIVTKAPDTSPATAGQPEGGPGDPLAGSGPPGPGESSATGEGTPTGSAADSEPAPTTP